MGFFRWLSTNVRNAVVAGVQEAMAELDQRPEVAAITFTVLALPAPEEKQGKKGRK